MVDGGWWGWAVGGGWGVVGGGRSAVGGRWSVVGGASPLANHGSSLQDELLKLIPDDKGDTGSDKRSKVFGGRKGSSNHGSRGHKRGIATDSDCHLISGTVTKVLDGRAVTVCNTCSVCTCSTMYGTSGVWCGVMCGTVHCGAVRCSIARCSYVRTVHCSTVHCSTALCRAVRYGLVW